MTGRIRTIKPEWLEDELLAAASDEARVLSVALILMADDHGRGRASTAAIATGAWRYQLEQDDGAHAPEVLARASRALRELHAMRFVTLYEVDRQRYFEIRNWSKHQRVDRPSKPRVPAPPQAENAQESRTHEVATEPSRGPRETLATDSRLTSDPIPPTPDPDRDRARARGLGIVHPSPPPAGSPVRLVAERFGERFKAATGKAWLGPSAIDAIERGNPSMPHRDVAEQLEALASWAVEQSNPAEAIDEALTGAFSDEWFRGATYPFSALAKNPAKYAAAGMQALKRQKRESKAAELAKARERQHEEAMARARAEAVEPPPDLAAMLGGIGRRV